MSLIEKIETISETLGKIDPNDPMRAEIQNHKNELENELKNIEVVL